jgi:hypothetical protein
LFDTFHLRDECYIPATTTSITALWGLRLTTDSSLPAAVKSRFRAGLRLPTALQLSGRPRSPCLRSKSWIRIFRFPANLPPRERDALLALEPAPAPPATAAPVG